MEEQTLFLFRVMGQAKRLVCVVEAKWDYVYFEAVFGARKLQCFHLFLPFPLLLHSLFSPLFSHFLPPFLAPPPSSTLSQNFLGPAKALESGSRAGSHCKGLERTATFKSWSQVEDTTTSHIIRNHDFHQTQAH